MKTREIKFRAWVIRSEAADKINTMRYESNDVIFDWAHNGVTMEIMQFTGLLDKNGKEIYEGDLIADEHSPILVKWNDRLATFGLERKGWAFTHFFQEAFKSDTCEIIGNIYENADLLK